MSDDLKKFMYWSWLDADGHTFYVGFGPVIDKTHPADRIWNSRHARDTELTRFLRQWPHQPTRVGSMEMMSKWVCNAGVSATKLAARKKGYRLLIHRDFESYVNNPKFKRPVIDPAGGYHPSVRAAARAHGVDPGAIVRRLRAGRGWRYA